MAQVRGPEAGVLDGWYKLGPSLFFAAQVTG